MYNGHWKRECALYTEKYGNHGTVQKVTVGSDKKCLWDIVMGGTALSSGLLGFWQKERGRQNIIGWGNSFSKGPGQTWAMWWRVTRDRWETDQGQAIQGPCESHGFVEDSQWELFLTSRWLDTWVLHTQYCPAQGSNGRIILNLGSRLIEEHLK